MLIYFFIDGIMSGCIQYAQDDDFSQNNPVSITVGSSLATIDLYCIRVYDNDLTAEQMKDNWIADTQDGSLLLERYARNNIYDEYGSILPANLPSDLPYMVIECAELPQYKLLQKSRPKDPITKKPDPTATFQSYYLTDDHKEIVSKADWEAVQRKLKENEEFNEMVGHRGGQPHFLFGKVFCGECGEPMTRRTWGKRKVWICRKQRNGVNQCGMRKIEENELLAVANCNVKRIVVKQDGLRMG